MPSISMKALLETGVHFGHRTRKWNAKMKPYIFAERNGIHILDLQQTLASTREAGDLVIDTVSRGGAVLFVGTKRQAQDTIAREASRAGMPYINTRWLGGTLTNWVTIRRRTEYLKTLEARRERGEFELIPKKEALTLNHHIEKLNMRLGGIRNLTALPKLLFIVDVRREHTAIREANSLGIPIIAMVDTNCDPDNIDFVIPANDDAIRAIKLITGFIADAALEGRALRADDMGEDQLADVYDNYDYRASELDEFGTEDEDFLGESTLAKLKSGNLSFRDEGSPAPVAAVAAESPEVEAAVETEDIEEEAL